MFFRGIQARLKANKDTTINDYEKIFLHLPDAIEAKTGVRITGMSIRFAKFKDTQIDLKAFDIYFFIEAVRAHEDWEYKNLIYFADELARYSGMDVHVIYKQGFHKIMGPVVVRDGEIYV